MGHSSTGVTSARNTTDTNPPQGSGESTNLLSNYPDIVTSNHQQSQASLSCCELLLRFFKLCYSMWFDGSENPPTRPQMDPDTTQSVSYNNSGTQCIRGFTDQTGYVRGNGNGIINFGNLGTSSFTRNQSVADKFAPRSDETFSYQNSGDQYICGVSNQTGCVTGNGNGCINLGNSKEAVQTLTALIKLIPRESHRGDGTRTQPNSSSTTLRGENNFIDTVEQTVEGLANEIGMMETTMESLTWDLLIYNAYIVVITTIQFLQLCILKWVNTVCREKFRNLVWMRKGHFVTKT